MSHSPCVYLLLFPQGRQPFLLHLLSLYKVFCPELVTLSIPSQMRVRTRTAHLTLCICCHFAERSTKGTVHFVFLQSGFRNHNSPWKFVLIGVQKRNGLQVASSISLALTMKDKTISRKRVCICLIFEMQRFFCLFAWSVNTESDTEDESKHQRPVLQCESQTHLHI